jgi:hypothetical protein
MKKKQTKQKRQQELTAEQVPSARMGCGLDAKEQIEQKEEATKLRTITEDEFYEIYKPMRNHLDPDMEPPEDAPWGGCMFETYGKEVEFVSRQDPRCIWTLVEGDTGNMLIMSGYHWVNRIGYFVATTPVPEGQRINVILD